jgi:hypothetical protein
VVAWYVTDGMWSIPNTCFLVSTLILKLSADRMISMIERLLAFSKSFKYSPIIPMSIGHCRATAAMA